MASMFAYSAILGESNPRARVEFLEQSLEEERPSAQLWYYGWLGAYGAVFAANCYAANRDPNRVVRITNGVSAVQTAVGIGAMLASPLPSAYASGRLQEMPTGTPEELEKKRIAAEGYLKDTAESEEFGRSWISHAANLVIAGGGALMIRYNYAQRINHAKGSPVGEAWGNFLSSVLVGEIQIFTQPTISSTRWNEYHGKYSEPESAKTSVMIRPLPDGLQAAVVFSF